MSRLASGVLLAFLCLVCLGAVAAGTAVPGLFWLTVVACGGLLVAGAFAVSLQLQGVADARTADGEGPSEERWPEPTSLDSRRRRQVGGDVSRAA